ncbi:interleukin-8-like [Narcine bancroftii]|uniref:interleukin-8-like n=1 Tax=Narcine bancroftii TaxID=1343680 RepID=UPI0038313537
MFSQTSIKVFSIIALCFVFTEAIPRLAKWRRCRCIELQDRLPLASKISNIKIFFKHAHCQNFEIIAKLKNGRRVCLNPSADEARNMIASMRKKRKV